MKTNPSEFRGAEHYDAMYKDPRFDSRHWCTAEASGYWDLIWQPALHALRRHWEMLQRVMPLAIVELGTGAGQFAELVDRKPNLEYLYGVDNSATAIEFAGNMFPHLKEKLLLEDFFHPEHLEWRQGLAADAVVCLEVLGHLPGEDDLRLLRECVMPKEFFVGSVSDFLGEGHVRAFDNPEDVRKRYMPFIDIQDTKTQVQAGNRWFTFWGNRR